MCNKNCKECEMLIEDHEIVIVEKTGLLPHRRYVRGVKCMKYGQSAYSTVSLPTSTMDDFIYR